MKAGGTCNGKNTLSKAFFAILVSIWVPTELWKSWESCHPAASPAIATLEAQVPAASGDGSQDRALPVSAQWFAL